jgi:hypothetical protein
MPLPPQKKQRLQNYRCQEGDISKFYTEGPQILGAVVQNLIGRATLLPASVYLWFVLTLKYY